MTNERAHSIKGLPLGELSITAIASIIDVYEDPETGNQIPEVEMEVINEKDWEVFSAPKSEARRCALCGHGLKIACAVTHKTTGNGYWIGRDCAKTVTALSGFDGIIKGATVALAQRIACEKREADFLAANPDAIGVIQWSKRPSAPRISRDIIEKLRRYGNISDKQLALLEKVRQQDIDRRAKATGTATAGRQTIHGVIRKVTVVNGERGERSYAKILVDLGNGVRLWGNTPEYYVLDDVTISRAEEWQKIGHETWLLTILKVGDTIQFKATVEPKADDPLFGFWKRPADFKMLKLAVDERAIAKANPVLAESDYQAKLAKWNALNDEARRRGLSLEEAAKWLAERMKAPDISTIDPQIAATPLLSPEANAAHYGPCPECSADPSAGHYMICSQREL
jgi:hypothetical protein